MDHEHSRDPVDDYLSGRITRDTLTPEDQVRADALQAAIEAAHALVGSGPPPQLLHSTMARVRQAPAPRARSWLVASLQALWAPRSIAVTWRPAYGVLAAFVIAAVALGPPAWRGGRPGQPAVVPTAGHSKIYVQFRVEAGPANRVRLAGTFSQWQPQYELRQTTPGVWTITLPLDPGVYDYAFVIDNDRWMPDPHAMQVADGFGGSNSRIALLPPDGL